jgi:plasmid stability protein
MEERTMAILNIKSVPEPLYRKLQARAKRERRSVTQEVLHILDQAVADSPQLSILDLQGLGKDVWRNIDVDQYLRTERDAWG